MFDEVKMRISVGKYLSSRKNISTVNLPVEVEKCMQTIKLWAGRFAADKEHGDKIIAAAVSSLVGSTEGS